MPCRHALAISLLLCLLCVRASDATSIVVNLGEYQSAEQAGMDEANVNWADADKADDTVCTEAFAALELQRYLRTMTGDDGDFVIVDDDREGPQVGKPTLRGAIVVGGTRSNAAARKACDSLGVSQEELDTLGPEDYVLKSGEVDRQPTIMIAGGSRIGTLYGVYDLLHRLGARWYAPGEVNEEAPQIKSPFQREFDVRESPKFFTRGFHAWEDRGDPEFLLWMARNRMNYWCVQQSEKALMHKLGIQMIGGGHVLTSFYLSPKSEYPYNHPKFDGDDDKPRDPYALGNEYQGDVNEDGKLSYFEAHPEWYALRHGKRSDRIHGDGGDNFCTSNADAMTEWMKNAVEDLATGQYKDAGLMNAWMLDGGKWCQCENCKALGSQTDRNLLFVYHYDKAVKKAQAEGRINRTVRLLFLAYADVLEPPTKPLPNDFDYETCIATYFPIVRCYVHNFNDPDCSKNARYDKHLHGWAVDPSRHYRGQICLGEYYNVSGYKCLPVCYMHTMANDLPYYYSLGARHFHYMHCTTANWGNKSLTNWQLARQLWDVDADCERLWEDYFTGRYGPVAKEMRGFYESLEKMLCNVSELKYGLARRLNGGAKNLFPTSHLKYEKTAFDKDDGPDLLEILDYARQCRAIIDGVRRQRLPERIAARIAEDERLFTYGETTLKFYDALCRTFALVREGKRDEARETFREATALADALKADTTSTKLSSSHASAKDAFVASYATGAMPRLSSILGPVEPEQAKLFDPATQPLTITGKEFQGGGGTVFDYGLRVYPGRIEVSKVGNYIYGAGTPVDRITAWFRLGELPAGDLYLYTEGLQCARPPGANVHAQIRVNDRLVYAGKTPFNEKGLSPYELVVPAKLLKEGMNSVEIRNVEPEGVVGNRPWFGIDRIELRDELLTDDPQPPHFEAPADLALSYRSEIDGTEQPYRLYLPSAYDGKTELPLFIALHGTGGDQNKYFDHPDYGDGLYKREAEKRGMMIVCPHGRGTTEYRGIGENDVLTVLEEVKKQFAVDEDRVVCSGQSMGGTGTTYLCTRYPDLFAAGVPLASCYGHMTLLENLRHVPMLYVQGAKDWPIYAKEGPLPITKRLAELGYDAELWMIPDQPHNTMTVSTERILDWSARQLRLRHPKRVTHNAYLPIHGKAYWTEIQEIDRIGYLAKLDVEVKDGNRLEATVSNAKRLAFRPEPQLLRLDEPVEVVLNGKQVFRQRCDTGQEIRGVLDGEEWRASLAPRNVRPPTAYRTHKIGSVVTTPTQAGKDETTMGNWMCDMMRSVTGADLAIYNRRHYRGVSFRAGQDVYLIDLLDWIRPFNRRLATFECTGKDLLEIIEANILDKPNELEFLVQVSGCRYAFDRKKPKGQRVIETDLDASKTYRVACEGQVLSRETLKLAGRFEKIEFEELEPTNISGAWRYIVECGGKIEAKAEGRVRDVTP